MAGQANRFFCLSLVNQERSSLLDACSCILLMPIPSEYVVSSS